MMHVSSTHDCPRCGDNIDLRRWNAGYHLCLFCGEEAAREERMSWCVLTPHKQGAMFVTAESARELAVGINNKQQR